MQRTTVLDELIVMERVCQPRSDGFGQFVLVESLRDEISDEVSAWCMPFGSPCGVDRSSKGRSACESNLEALLATAQNAPSQTSSWGVDPQGKDEGEVFFVLARPLGKVGRLKPTM